MKRRTFIAGLGSAAAWPLAVRAQQGERIRRIGWLLNSEENDPVSQALATAFREGLARLGWIEGRNLRIDYRFTGIDTNRVNEAAAELVTLVPDAIVVTGTQSLRAAKRQTQKIPIVATSVGDPVASGMVGTLARSDGNATGFSLVPPATAVAITFTGATVILMMAWEGLALIRVAEYTGRSGAVDPVGLRDTGSTRLARGLHVPRQGNITW